MHDPDDGVMPPGTDNFLHRPARRAGGSFFGALLPLAARGGQKRVTKLLLALRASLCRKFSVPGGLRPSSRSSLASLQSSH